MALKKNVAAPAAKPAAPAPAAKPTLKPAVKPAVPAPKPAAKPAPQPVEAPAAEAAEVVEVVNIGRKDIAARIREKVIATGAAISPKVAETVAVAYEEVVAEALAAGEKITLPGFGVFSVVAKDEQERPNPQKPGEKVVIPAHNAPKFKVGSKLKQAVNGGAEAEEVEEAVGE